MEKKKEKEGRVLKQAGVELLPVLRTWVIVA